MPPISALPAAPDPNDRSTFNARAYPWSVALNGMTSEINAVLPAIDSASAASAAAIAAAKAPQESPVPMVVSWPWLRGVISAIPTRVEKSGGQNQRYVALDEVLGWLEEGQRRADEAQRARAEKAEPMIAALQAELERARTLAATAEKWRGIFLSIGGCDEL